MSPRAAGFYLLLLPAGHGLFVPVGGAMGADPAAASEPEADPEPALAHEGAGGVEEGGSEGAGAEGPPAFPFALPFQVYGPHAPSEGAEVHLFEVRGGSRDRYSSGRRGR